MCEFLKANIKEAKWTYSPEFRWLQPSKDPALLVPPFISFHFPLGYGGVLGEDFFPQVNFSTRYPTGLWRGEGEGTKRPRDLSPEPQKVRREGEGRPF